jgi:DNA-binding transcriptional ArsR family regulator
MNPITSIDDPRYVKAMSHPLRVRILAILQERTASPVELAQVLDATLGTVSYHVRTLHHLGLIELVDETRVRGAVEHHYKAKPRPTVSDEAWAQAPPIAKQAAVGSSLQMIDEYARASAASGGFDHGDAALIRLSLSLDAKGWQQLAKAVRKLHEQADRIEADAAERMAGNPSGDGEARDVGMVIMMFEAVALGEAIDEDRGRHRRGGRSRSRVASKG